ncbi:protein serine/threonine kinase [Pelomyxa schiedti]|nr:protein serine/threonine kinase [Pelomyxa schiedti]
MFVSLKIHMESMLSTFLDFDEIQLHKPCIGEGSYGIVYKAEWRSQEVAVKVIKFQEGTDAMSDFMNEVRALEAVRCPQIVHFYGACRTPGKLAIVTEFFSLGNLANCLKTYPFSPRLKLKCLLDCARGMNFLHSSHFLHRDLKTDNLLMVSLDELAMLNCKLTDFGTTRDINRIKATGQYTIGIGTPAFMAPELLKNGAYNESVDVYSFSHVAYHVITGTEPFAGFPSMNH